MTAIAPFSFSTVPHLVSQAGAAGQLGQHVRTHFPQARRAMIVTDPGFLRTGLVDAPARDLEKHNLTVQIYSDVMADPPEQIVLKAVEFARQHAVDIVVGLGGGWSMDVAELLALMAATDSRSPDIWHRQRQGPAPEAAADPDHRRYRLGGDADLDRDDRGDQEGRGPRRSLPDLAILDAELTVGCLRRSPLPPASTRWCTRSGRHQQAQEDPGLPHAGARGAVAVGNEHRLRRRHQPGGARGHAARRHAGRPAFSNAPVAAVHALAYPIGGIFHVPHGLSNALVLPHVLRFNQPDGGRRICRNGRDPRAGIEGTQAARAAGLTDKMRHVDTIRASRPRCAGRHPPMRFPPCWPATR